MVEYVLCEQERERNGQGPYRLLSGWFIGLAMNGLLTAHAFRSLAGIPSVEYVLESETTRHPPESYHIAPIGRRHHHNIIGPVQDDTLEFPSLRMGSVEEINRMLHSRYKDLCNAAGAHPQGDLVVEIPEISAH